MSQTILEALRELTLLEVKTKQIDSDKYIVHYTGSIEALYDILIQGKFNVSKKDDTVSFSQGYDSNSGLPLQQLRGKDYWIFGIQLLNESNKFNLSPYSAIKKNLGLYDSDKPKTREDLIKINDIIELNNGDCWICFTARDLPVHISKEFYDYLMEVVEFQSKEFLDSHKVTNPKEPVNFYRIQKSYPNEISIKNHIQFRTDKANHGVYITADPDYQIVGMGQKDHRGNINHPVISAKQYIDDIKTKKQELEKLKTEISVKIKRKQNRLSDLEKKLEEIDAWLLNRRKNHYTDYDYQKNQERRELKELIEKIKVDIEQLNNIIKSKQSEINYLLNTFATPRNSTKSGAGGAVIYLESKYIDELVNSISLDERELIFLGDKQHKELYFDYNDIDALYLPMTYKVKEYEFNMEKYCDDYFYNHSNIQNIKDYFKIKVNKTPNLSKDQMDRLVNDSEINEFLKHLNEILTMKSKFHSNSAIILYNKNQSYNIR